MELSKLLLIMSLISGFTFLLLTWHWFIHPKQDFPTHADAIVVFAGGKGERFNMAEKLVNEGVSSTLIVNVGSLSWPGQAEILLQCQRKDLPYHLICVLVEEDNTAGEARQFAQMAYNMGLVRLVAVTSDFHLTRASVLLSQCYAGTIMRVGSKEKVLSQWPHRAMIKALIHEWGGLLYAWTIERFRNCPQ